MRRRARWSACSARWALAAPAWSRAAAGRRSSSGSTCLAATWRIWCSRDSRGSARHELMRTLFLLLVAANLALFAWFHYYSPAESAADPEPARRQLSPERIRLLEGKELKSLASARP